SAPIYKLTNHFGDISFIKTGRPILENHKDEWCTSSVEIVMRNISEELDVKNEKHVIYQPPYLVEEIWSNIIDTLIDFLYRQKIYTTHNKQIALTYKWYIKDISTLNNTDPKLADDLYEVYKYLLSEN